MFAQRICLRGWGWQSEDRARSRSLPLACATWAGISQKREFSAAAKWSERRSRRSSSPGSGRCSTVAAVFSRTGVEHVLIQLPAVTGPQIEPVVV